MDADDRQFLLTTAWLFARHGQPSRARLMCEALVEADPKDGVSAAALAELLLSDGEGDAALRVLQMAEFPEELTRAEAILETRALAMIGRKSDSVKRWNRYIESRKGANRNWVSE